MQLLINLAIWSYVAWLSTCNLTDMEWAIILPDMASLCPSVDVCGRTGEGVTNVSTDRNQCCLDCSCDSSCHATHGHCCFDDKNTTPANITACLIPSTNQDINGFGGYTFVLRPPINGCKCQYDATTSATCTSDISVAPWGNFFPVYSKSLNMNFKNEPCALCHGADITDIEPWTSIITYIGGSSEAFASTMTDFYETFNSNDAAVVFEPPSKESRSMDKRCFEVIEGCSPHFIDEFYIPSVVQLNRSTIVEACTYGPKALYVRDIKRAYKNVYCALCNWFAVEKFDVLTCRVRGDRGITMLPFTSVLDMRAIQSLKSTKKNENRSRPCFRQVNVTYGSGLRYSTPEDRFLFRGISSNSSRCVYTYCPALQVRLPDGKCDFPAGKEITGCLILALNLSTAHVINVSDISNVPVARRSSLFEEKNPWSRFWKIEYIDLLTVENRTEFQVRMSLKSTRRLRMRDLLDDIQRRLVHPWNLTINNEIEFTQGIVTLSRPWESLLHIYRAPTMVIHAPLCAEINQMFFCQQIELLPSEYRLESQGLHLMHTGRLLYQNEYTLIVGRDKSTKVRVCLENSGYARVNSTSDAEHMSHWPAFIAMVMMMLARVLVEGN